MLLLIVFAFLAGLATVLSPCVFPVLPAILSASASGGKGRPIGVILGLTTSFVFFTLSLTTLVQSFDLSANVLRYTAIVIIGIFGIILLFPSLSNKFTILTDSFANFGVRLQERSRSQKSGLLSGLIIGIALGLVWTPCAGPILAAITTLVATQKVSIEVLLLICAYSIGAAFPLFLIAYGGQRLFNLSFLAKYAENIRQFFGAFMILTALALALNWDIYFQQLALKYFPNIQIEKNVWVEEQLQKLRRTSPFVQSYTNKKNGKEDLPYIAPAPDLTGITAWINSRPLTLEQLKGKVVLIDFWTYSCINCIRTFPYLRYWYDTYKDKDFLIIGVHTPEFEFEKNEANVKEAAKRFHLMYPIAMDNHYQTWEAFYNYYWPAHYLIDQNGIVREVHFGEGEYLETENAIRYLLHLPLINEEKKNQQPTDLAEITPEIYLGYTRAEAYLPEIQIVRDKMSTYSYQQSLNRNHVGLKGKWTVSREYITSESNEAELSLNFNANQVYLVLGGASEKSIQIELDGQPLSPSFFTADINKQGEIQVKEPRKYDIVNLKGQHEHILTLYIPKGIQVYAFTFGVEFEDQAEMSAIIYDLSNNK